jgi:RNA polymerase sigma-70 factor (ECF subfamily)
MNDPAANTRRSPPDAEVYEAFLGLYSREQARIQAFIRSLVPDLADADDLFQKTSLVMWRSFATFDREKPFLPWALGVARHQVLVHWRTRRRDRHVFSEAFLVTLADEMTERLVVEGADRPTLADRQRALDACVEQLPPRQQELVRRFYGGNEPAGTIAASWSRSVHAVYKALKVMRKALEECVERRLAALGDDLPPLADGLAPD